MCSASGPRGAGGAAGSGGKLAKGFGDRERQSARMGIIGVYGIATMHSNLGTEVSSFGDGRRCLIEFTQEQREQCA